jgi:hypothetical protein
MQRHFIFALVCTMGASALALPVAVRALVTDAERRAPESLSEAIEVADTVGLFHRNDGIACRENWCLLVSETEMPCGWPRLNNPSHPFWIGTVAIYSDMQSLLEANYDPACSIVWGRRFVYGDPNLIEKLTGRRP